LEEKLEGEEFTLQAFSDGSRIRTLPAVQDHKRLLPDDFGPNTGGMGSYSCMNGLLPFLSQKEHDSGTRILLSVVRALDREGCPDVGPIYVQIMLTKEGVKVIEFNARFGDPEAMNVLPLLQSDFVELCTIMLDGKLDEKPLEVEEKSTVCKYVVPEGYGVKSRVGEKISVDESAITKCGAKLFYASVTKKDGDIVTLSSRSLAVVGIADELSAAEQLCEQALSFVKGEHIFIRHDVGTKPLIDKRVRHMNLIRGKK
jgi:phosphoribosylamine--glycine ligase